MTTSVSDVELTALIAGLNSGQHGDVRCGVTELLAEQCAHCRPAPPAERDNTGLGPWITSRYPGKCSGCGSRFDLFDQIRADGDGGWLANCCGNIGDDHSRPRTIPAGPPPSTVAEMRDVLADLDASRPRSQQTSLGPSELGTPCQRQLAMKLAGVPRQLPDSRPSWAPMQGTAMHTLMEEALRSHNTKLGRERWVIEERLHMDAEISGAGDAFDTDTGTVVDWKYVGVTTLKKVKRKTIPNDQLVRPDYRVQAHLYGYGHQRAGRDVRWVRLVFLARSHNYDDSAEWTEAYQPEIAMKALHRYYATQDLLTALDVAANPGLWPVVPAATSDDVCTWCPFRRAGSPADGTGCPGNTQTKIDKQTAGLIA